MFCKNCGQSLKETEKFCPKCGTQVTTASQPAGSADAGGLFMPQDMPKSENADTNKAAEAISAAGEKAKALIGGVKMPVLIAIGGILLVLVVLVANGARVNNFAHRTFSSPEKYYRYVESKAVDEMTSAVGDMYEAYFLDWVEWYDKSIRAEVSVEIGEAGEDLLDLAKYAGADLSWLKSFSVEGEANIKEDVISLGAGFGINKEDLLSGNLLIDMAGESMYVQIPELTKTYLGVEGDLELEDYWDMLDGYKGMASAIPSKAQVEKIAKRYVNIALDCIDDVSKNKKTLKAGGVEQNCTVLEVTIDDSTREAILEAVLEEMQDDKDIKKIIVNLADAMGEDGADVYDEFVEQMEEMRDSLGYSESGTELVMKVYVDGKGEIRGRTIEFDDGWGTVVTKWLMPVKGGKFGFELSAGIEDEKMEMTGSGKISGDKITGDFKIKAQDGSGVSFAVDKLDMEKLKRGQLDGGIEIDLSFDLGDMGLGELAYMLPGMSGMQDLALTIDSKASKHAGDVKFGIKYDGEELGAVAVSFETGDGSKKSIPSGKNVVMVEDLGDLGDWLETCEWGKLISALEKLGVPGEVIDMLEELEDGDIDSLLRYVWYLY